MGGYTFFDWKKIIVLSTQMKYNSLEPFSPLFTVDEFGCGAVLLG